jgi:hypothetical protein
VPRGGCEEETRTLQNKLNAIAWLRRRRERLDSVVVMDAPKPVVDRLGSQWVSGGEISIRLTGLYRGREKLLALPTA